MPLPNTVFPAGELRFVYLHWTAGDYAQTFSAYHFCVTRARGAAAVVATHDLRANMRVVGASDADYAAHTAGRNSFAAGIAVCGMRDALPQDFGPFPLRDDALDLTCALVARLCAAYAIPVDAAHVRTHAEAALEDGYFGAADGERWDIARLAPSPFALVPQDALATGEALRARVRTFS